MDRFQELSAFIAVAEAGGFSAAARRTGSSQSAISKAIGALEKRLGVALFNRSTRRVTLTDQGQRYFDRTKPLLDEIGAADNELTSSTLDISGRMRIAAPSTFGRLHVLPLIPGLLSRHPGLKVELLLSDAARDMVEDRIDLTIRVGTVNEPDAVVRRIGSTSLVCVGSRRYFESKGTPKTPADLVDHNCLVYEGMVESTHWPFTGPEGPFNVPVRGNFSSNSVDAIRTGVLAGVGIGMFTRASLAEELAHPDVVTILNDFVRGTRDVSVVWPQRRFISARVHRVTDYFVQALSPRL